MGVRLTINAIHNSAKKIVGKEESLISSFDIMLWISLVFIRESKAWIHTSTGGGEYTKKNPPKEI
jgi:hypothetical protein